MSLFGIPFLIGSVIFWSLALMSIWGKVEVTFDKRGGKVFTGLWQIGLTKRFAWEDISKVTEAQSGYSAKNGFKNRTSGTVIRLEGKKRISFGVGLNESRRYYLLMAVKNILGKKKSGRSRAM
ncbi:hypothetical protein R9C00_02660 [Flammeovirgaceae bacterium SG7u.111]|nr:hypothetical protein [Flammeovirgaceae bacterium SG7u.132]WPO36341.1 hypothetical protein R9C00_02660 [Flammeovirgaceae bacterium SG7u.111]